MSNSRKKGKSLNIERRYKNIKATEEMRIIWEFENEILELVDNQNDYTRSDLQGRVTAIVMNILRKGKELGKTKK